MAYKVLVEDARGARGESPLRGGVNFVGRSPRCEVRVDTPFASRRHAKLVVLEDHVEIYDLDSHNGLFVNGEKVRSRNLTIGDSVFLGAVRLVLEQDTEGRGLEQDHDSQLARAPKPVELAESLDALQERGARETLDISDPSVRNLAILYRVTERFGRAGSTEEFLRDVLAMISELTQAHTAVLLLAGADGALQARGVLRDGEVTSGGQLPVSWKIAEKVVAEGSALFSRDAKADAATNSGLWDVQDAGAVMCVPIMHGDRGLGCVYLTRPFADAGFSDREVETVTAVTHLLGTKLSTPLSVASGDREGGLERFLDSTLPPRMAERLLQQAEGSPLGGSLADREEGVVLFAEITGLDELATSAPTEHVSLLLGQFHAVIQQATRSNGGFVENTIGSGALAFFPTKGDAGSEVTALNAGAAIVGAREALAAIEPGLGVRVGMDYGLVLSGLFGGEGKRVYSVVGAPVRTATRVAEIAQPGQLLCTGAVRDVIGDTPGFQVVALGPHALRGRAEPIALFLVGPGRPRREEDKT